MLLSVVTGNLLSKKLRTLLTVAGFGVCVNLHIVVTTVMRFISEDLDMQMQRFTGRLVIQSRSAAGTTGIEWPPISSSIPLEAVERVLASDRVQRSKSTAVSFAVLAPPPFATAPPEALVVGLEIGREDAFLAGAPAMLGTNRLPADSGAAGHEPAPVILGVLAARYLAAQASATTEVESPIGPIALAAPGSDLEIRGAPFRVIGIIEPQTNQLLRSCVVMPLESARALLGQTETVGAAIVTPRRTKDIAELEAELEASHPALMVVSDKQLTASARQLLDRTQQFFRVVRWTAVVVAALLITVVMFVAVLERTKELGTLRAIGAPGSAITGMILAEALLVALAGSALGVPISRLVIMKALGPDAAAIRSRRIEAQSVGLLTTLGLLAAILPAVRALRVDPIVALRYE